MQERVLFLGKTEEERIPKAIHLLLYFDSRLWQWHCTAQQLKEMRQSKQEVLLVLLPK